MSTDTLSARHRRAVEPDSRPEVACNDDHRRVCPRHHPDMYAESMAVHATDSIGPQFETVGYAYVEVRQ